LSAARLSDFVPYRKAATQPAIDAFDRGREALNKFLIRFALQNQQAEASQTYVALADDEIVGYYTLVVGQVEYDDTSDRLKKGLTRTTYVYPPD
jgi:hypothetical protein